MQAAARRRIHSYAQRNDPRSVFQRVWSGGAAPWLAVVALFVVTGCSTIAPSLGAPIGQEGKAPTDGRSPFEEPPGVLFADVTQANIVATICVSGWTATVRPTTSFTQGLKKLMLTRASVDPSDAALYKLDHFVPLALGGHPRAEDNLWLQRWDGVWNARIKDRLERRLQVMVCAGQITLRTARTAVQHDWQAAFRKYIGANSPANLLGFESEEEVVE